MLHNIGNAISSVATGVATLHQKSRDNELLSRFTALAAAVEEHDDDWVDWLRSDPQGQQVRAFFLALVKDFRSECEGFQRMAARVSNRVEHIVDIIRTQESFTDGTVEPKLVALRPTLDDAVKVLGASFEQRGIAVRVDCAAAPDEVRLQESKFHQMLVNLLMNALEALRRGLSGRRGPGVRAVRAGRRPHRRRFPGARRDRQRHRYRSGSQGGTDLLAGLPDEADGQRARPALGGELRHRGGRKHRGAERGHRARDDDAGEAPPGAGCRADRGTGGTLMAEPAAGLAPDGAMRNRQVLIVDDPPAIHHDFREMLRHDTPSMASDEMAASFAAPRSPSPLPVFELLHARGGEIACDMVGEARRSGRPVAAAYIDIRMPPGISGIETVRRMRDIDLDIEVVLMTAYTDQPMVEIVRDMALLHKLLYIRKPFAREEIQQITLSLVTKWNVEQEVTAGRRRLSGSHRRLESVLDATGDAIAMYDGSSRLAFGNRCYQQLLDVSSDEMQAMPQDAALRRFTERRHAPGDGRPGTKSGGGAVVEPPGAEEDKAPVLPDAAARAGRLRGGDRKPRRVPGRIAGDRGRADEAGGGAPAGRAGRHLRAERHRRVERGHPAGVRAGEAGSRQRRERAGPGRERHGQGAGSQGAALQRPPADRAVRGGQLGGGAGDAGRE